MTRAARIAFTDRLVAEAVRLSDREASLPPRRVESAEAAAREAGGDFETRIVARAAELPVAGGLRDALGALHRGSLLLIGVGAILAALAGATTVRAALGAPDDEPVNVYWLLASVLGVQTIALAIWAGIMIVRPRKPGAFALGSMVMGLARRVARKLHSGPDHGAALAAQAAAFGRGALGSWLVAAISHLLWTTFNLGAVLALVAFLSAKHYTFGWETTILDRSTYVPMTRVIAAAPHALGFPVPDDEQIAASEWTGNGPPPESARGAWSGFILGSLVVYGLAPRVALLTWSLLMLGRAQRRFRLDVTHAEYARLRPRLMPVATPIGVVDPETNGDVTARPADGQRAPERPAGAPAIVGLEVETQRNAWPPPAGDVRWTDLGIVETREDRKRVIERLTSSVDEPEPLIVVCDLTTTPDRGMVALLREIQTRVHHPIELILTGGARLRKRSGVDGVGGRLADWRGAAQDAGLVQVHECDLDHLTTASEAKLSSIVMGGTSDEVGTGRLRTAASLIKEHLDEWPGAPSAAEQVQLLRAIDRHYGRGGAAWRDLMPSRERFGEDVIAQLAPAAQRVAGMLPPRLLASRKWVAAGALTGALGGLAAVTFVAPAAIGTLPLWGALGGVIGGLMTPKTRDAAGDDDGLFEPGRADAVRAAALHAMLLDLQGRPEEAITRVLDGAIPDDDDLDEPESDAALRAWLDELCHDYDVALLREGSIA